MALQNAFTDLSTADQQQLIVSILQQLLNRTTFPDPTLAAVRNTIVGGTLPTVTTVGTVSSVATANITSIGSYFANGDQYCQWQIPYSLLRARIVVS
jgi:hypothetical protein